MTRISRASSYCGMPVCKMQNRDEFKLLTVTHIEKLDKDVNKSDKINVKPVCINVINSFIITML